MRTLLPSADQVRTGLQSLSLAELSGLSVRSGVPFSTLVKIRNGHTPNPGLETVRKFYPHIPTGAEKGASAGDGLGHGSSTNDPQASQRAEQGVANA